MLPTIRLPLGKTSDRTAMLQALHMHQGMLPTIRLPLGQTSDRTAMLPGSTHAPSNVTYHKTPSGTDL